MATSYVVLDQTPATHVLGPSQQLEAERVEFITKPSGIYGQRLVPRAAWATEGASAWIAPVADAIEGLIAGGLASYASWVQNVDPGSNLVSDAYEFVVAYDPGDGRPIMYATATVPAASLTLDTQFGGVLDTYFGGGGAVVDPAEALRAAYDALVRNAGL